MENKNQSKEIVPAETPTEKVALTADFGTVYIKRTDDGQIMRPIRAVMTLSEKKGQLYDLKGSKHISGAGYVHLNKTASINLVTPESVVVDGVKQPNPYVERDPKTRVVLTVNVRKMGIGYSPAGQIVAIDKTLYYNIYTYFIQSIESKVKKFEYAKKEVAKKNQKKADEMRPPAVIGTMEDRPKPEYKNGAKWAFFVTAEPLGLWIDYTDPAIVECLNEHTQRQRFGDRIAQKIVERNILKDHPAIGVGKVEVKQSGQDYLATVTVSGFRHELAPEDITSIRDQAEKGAETIEIKPAVIDITPDEEKEVIDETTVEAAAENGQKPLKMEG